jgi:hypothetical protein
MATKPKTPKPKPEPVEAKDTITCALCAEHPVFDGRPAFFDHCEAAHPEFCYRDEAGKRKVRAQSKTGCHIDADRWFSWEFTWILADGTALAFEKQVMPRRGRAGWPR